MIHGSSLVLNKNTAIKVTGHLPLCVGRPLRACLAQSAPSLQKKQGGG